MDLSQSPQAQAGLPAAATAEPVPVPEDVVRAIVAEELESIREMLEELGIILCVEPAIVQKYSEVLQGLDELAQRNENLARVLRASDMVGAIDRITLGTLRSRMTQSIDAVAQGGEQPVTWVQV